MGRKSALSADQWIEVERRHLIGGESVNSLAKEYGINEAAIRRKINPNKSEQKNSIPPLKALALAKVKVDEESRHISEQIAELPYAKQQIVSDLSRKLATISDHLSGAAEFGAATAHRLAGIANGKVQEIDDAAPLSVESMESLKGIAVLTRMANEASEIPLGLLKANKEAVDGVNRPTPDKPLTLDDFYGTPGVPAESSAA